MSKYMAVWYGATSATTFEAGSPEVAIKTFHDEAWKFSREHAALFSVPDSTPEEVDAQESNAPIAYMTGGEPWPSPLEVA